MVVWDGQDWSPSYHLIFVGEISSRSVAEQIFWELGGLLFELWITTIIMLRLTNHHNRHKNNNNTTVEQPQQAPQPYSAVTARTAVRIMVGGTKRHHSASSSSSTVWPTIFQQQQQHTAGNRLHHHQQPYRATTPSGCSTMLLKSSGGGGGDSSSNGSNDRLPLSQRSGGSSSSGNSARRLWWMRILVGLIGGTALLIRYESLVLLSRALEVELGYQKKAMMMMSSNNNSSFATSYQRMMAEDDGHGDDDDGNSSIRATTDASSSSGPDASSTTTISSSSSRTLPVCAAVDEKPVVTIKSIRSYLAHMPQPEDWVLLKWNPDGSFDHNRAQTSTRYAHWTPPPDVLGQAKPSAHGRVVLLLNSDRLPLVPWSVRPPVPVWVYSKPIGTFDPRQLPDPLPARCDLDRVTLVPSPYDRLIWNRYCVEVVDREVQRRTFGEKLNKVIWRGAIHFGNVERSRVALLQYAQTHANETREWLDVQEINKREEPGHMELKDLAEYRYHLDIGGLSGTAWGGLRWKLCTGLLVFKVDSWANDWWYDTLEPWVHYIPVKADVSDLPEQYQWTQDNPEQAEEIARTGRERCLETLGEEKAAAHYQAVVQQVPAAEASIVLEAEYLLEQMQRHKTDMRGIIVAAES